MAYGHECKVKPVCTMACFSSTVFSWVHVDTVWVKGRMHSGIIFLPSENKGRRKEQHMDGECKRVITVMKIIT
jgi:hypothetical protein